MNRRNLMSSLAAGAAGTAFLATTALSVRQAQAAATMGEAEMKHAMETKKVGTLSLTASRVAQKMAKAPKVKEFADFETAEQETIADILKTMESGSDKAEGALHPPSEAEAEAMLDAEGKKKLDELKAMKEGSDFDKAYVAAQLDGHKKLLTIQEDYLKVGKDREHLSVAKLARGQVKEHIQLLEDIKSMMG